MSYYQVNLDVERINPLTFPGEVWDFLPKEGTFELSS
jgi:hypothetical protein